MIIKAIKIFNSLNSDPVRFAWPRSDEANKIADKAERRAWNQFKAQYPNADLSKFSMQVSFDDKR